MNKKIFSEMLADVKNLMAEMEVEPETKITLSLVNGAELLVGASSIVEKENYLIASFGSDVFSVNYLPYENIVGLALR